jgi:hypothetical protein
MITKARERPFYVGYPCEHTQRGTEQSGHRWGDGLGDPQANHEGHDPQKPMGLGAHSLHGHYPNAKAQHGRHDQPDLAVPTPEPL